jgi:radical SAM protein with 4Fe4S-binding SPASM domain
VGEFSHILNPFTGKLVSLSIEDFKLLKDATKEDLDREILETIHIPNKKAPNSRKFRTNLINLGAEYNFPTVVNIEITRRCLLDCKHCYITSEEHKNSKRKGLELLNKDEIDTLIKNLHDMGVFLIVLTGGEPCISSNIRDYIDACTKYNVMFEIFSCLQIIPDWLNSSLKNLSRIQVSIYSLDDEIHDSITQKVGSLKNSLRNINKLKKMGFYIEIATPIMTLNFEDRVEINKYFKDLGIQQNFSWPILNEYYTPHTQKTSLNISKEQFLQFTKEDPDFLIHCEWKIKDLPLCEAGISVLSISADGSVFPCSQYPLMVGNIFEEEIHAIYQGKRMKDAISYKAEDLCSDCEYYNFCIGNNYTETGDPLKQPTFMVESLNYAMKDISKKEVT